MKKAPQHYVDNVRLYTELKKYKTAVNKAKAKKKTPPGVSDYVGECFLQIATHLSHRPNFVNYSYRDDMIADGVENCLQYVNNFDPDKSKNPFSYFTQVIFYAFLRRIGREKKHTYIKYKVAEHQAVTQGDFTMPDGGLDRTSKPGISQPMLDYENMHTFINQFESAQETKRTKRATKNDTPTVWDEDEPDEVIIEPVKVKKKKKV